MLCLIAEFAAGEGVAIVEDAILLLVVPLVASSIFGKLARRLGFSAARASRGLSVGSSGNWEVAVLIIIFLTLVWRYAQGTAQRLEAAFEIR